jgi:uncharacterized protein YdeI (YjbR/CyaY-like superfamily)
MTDLPLLTIRSRADLRAWLAENHAAASSQWLATFKRHHPDYLAYEPIVQELLCWGWIDSRTMALDADRSAILIARRNPRSAWSAINKAHAATARADGSMTPAGEALITAALANGMWVFLDDVERLEVPPDLAAALTQTETAPQWEAFPRSVKRGTLEWIKTAKGAETRAKRIADVTGSAAQGLRPSPFRRG